MSFFFFIVTVLTLLFSHFWARRTRPVTPSSFAWTKNFSGSLEDFHKSLEKFVKSQPELLILEKTKHKYLISQSPSLFEFGNFYHLKLEETEEGVIVNLEVQAKLVEPTEKKVKHFLRKIGESND